LPRLRGSETCHVYIVQRCCGKRQGHLQGTSARKATRCWSR
jgi:hypothetical protein